uniref:LIM domain only 4b n=1 Tax=Fundulus heteroclitus TaxID=8078 RepID=A0A3Q2NX49_FUNHE
MVNPGGNSQPPAVGTGSLSWKRCAGCGGKIADRFLLYTMDSYWHSRCLKCSCCQAQLGEIGTSCYTKSGMILCRNDYIRLFGNSGACSACGQSIPASELVMRAQGNVYHLKCFTCSTCRNRLVPGDRFHYINGSLFCEHDRPTALINGHLSSLQTNPLLPDQKLVSLWEAVLSFVRQQRDRRCSRPRPRHHFTGYSISRRSMGVGAIMELMRCTRTGDTNQSGAPLSLCGHH